MGAHRMKSVSASRMRRLVKRARGAGAVEFAEWLASAADTIERLTVEKKAAAERVRWALVHGHYVAIVGRDGYTLTCVGEPTRLRLTRIPSATGDARRPVDMGVVSSLEAAARRIRAYRAGKWPRKET